MHKVGKEGFVYFGLFALALFCFVAVIRFGTYNVGKENPNVEFGVTFSILRARELGLDWKQAYRAMLDDLGVLLVRVPVYWNDVEPEENSYHFDDYHWMIREAEERGVRVIPVVGMRVPRWPECHIPQWAKDMYHVSRIMEQGVPPPRPPLSKGGLGGVETTASFVTRTQEEYNRFLQSKILKLLEKEVKEFKSYPNILYWQVENEPLLTTFGQCPFHDLDFYRREAALVRLLDSGRPVMAADTGELSSWIDLANISDVLGVSLYRTTFNKYVGFFYYPLPPLFYQKKAELVSHLTDRVLISELQSEPWIEGSVAEASLADQLENFPLSRMRDTVSYAKKTGIDPILLWGVEWWYYMKEYNQRPEYWDYAKTIFREEN